MQPNAVTVSTTDYKVRGVVTSVNLNPTSNEIECTVKNTTTHQTWENILCSNVQRVTPGKLAGIESLMQLRAMVDEKEATAGAPSLPSQAEEEYNRTQVQLNDQPLSSPLLSETITKGVKLVHHQWELSKLDEMIFSPTDPAGKWQGTDWEDPSDETLEEVKNELACVKMEKLDLEESVLELTKTRDMLEKEVKLLHGADINWPRFHKDGKTLDHDMQKILGRFAFSPTQVYMRNRKYTKWTEEVHNVIIEHLESLLPLDCVADGLIEEWKGVLATSKARTLSLKTLGSAEPGSSLHKMIGGVRGSQEWIGGENVLKNFRCARIGAGVRSDNSIPELKSLTENCLKKFAHTIYVIDKWDKRTKKWDEIAITMVQYPQDAAIEFGSQVVREAIILF